MRRSILGVVLFFRRTPVQLVAFAAVSHGAYGQFFPCEFNVAVPVNLDFVSSVVVDLNGDGRADVVSNGGNGLVALLGTSFGYFQPISSPGQPTGAILGGIAAADFNGDGNIDVARSSYENNSPSQARVVIAFGLGNGSFHNELQLLAGNWATEVEAGDIDGDGDVDVVCGTELNGVQVWMNRGDGTFASRLTYAAGTINRQMELRDVSGDGRLDIIVINETTNQLSVLVNNGSGAFPVRKTYSTGSYPTGLAVADFSGDGRLDVFVGHRNTGEVRLFRNVGAGVLDAGQSIGSIASIVGAPIGWLLAGDFDGDGDPDLGCVSGYSGTARWRLVENVAGTFVPGALQVSSATGWGAALGQLDADSLPDLLICESTQGVAGIALRGFATVCDPTCTDADLFPSGTVNGADLGILLSQWGAAPAGTVSDLNGDGTVDGADLGVLLSFWGPCNG